jgi:hypothetical protein
MASFLECYEGDRAYEAMRSARLLKHLLGEPEAFAEWCRAVGADIAATTPAPVSTAQPYVLEPTLDGGREWLLSDGTRLPSPLARIGPGLLVKNDPPGSSGVSR